MTATRPTAAILRTLGACDDAVAWAGTRTPARAWRECPHADWLLWVAARVGVDRRALVLAACDCAATSLARWERLHPDDRRPHAALRAARAWARRPSAAAAAAYAADAAAAAHADAARAGYASSRLAALVRRRIAWATVRDAARRRGGLL